MSTSDTQFELPALAVPVIEIDEARRDTYLENGYGPEEPTVNGVYSPAYSSEFYSVLNKLKHALERHWKYGIETGDYFLVADLVPHRFLGVEVSDARMLNQQLLPVVHRAIADCSPPFSVDVCNSWVFLKDENGGNYPDFNIFVEKDQVLIYSESTSLFTTLGLIPVAPE